MNMAKKKKQDIIKEAPNGQDVVLDYSFQNAIVNHTKAFGFSDVMINVIEAYRSKARKYNAEANRLEKLTKP